MRTSSLVWTVLAASVPSHAIDQTWGNIGLGSGNGPWPLAEGFKKGEEAGRTPNATRSVTFQHKYNNTNETWGWRINITDLAIPNNPNQFGNASANSSENHHVTNTQWQLTWPGDDDTFNEYLQKRNVTASFAAYIGVLPSNVTNRYDASNTNGDCTALLGADCVAGLRVGASGNTPSILSQNGCESTLDLRSLVTSYSSAIAWSTNGTIPDSRNSTNSRFNQTERYILERDGTFYYQTSAYYNATNTTMLDLTKGAVQILVMRLRPNIVRTEVVTGTYEPSILCQIVDKGAGQTGAAVGWRVSMGSVWVVAVLSSLVVMM